MGRLTAPLFLVNLYKNDNYNPKNNSYLLPHFKLFHKLRFAFYNVRRYLSN